MLTLKPMLVALVAMLVVCTVQAAPTVEDLLTETLATLEEAMMKAMDTAEPEKSVQHGMVTQYVFGINAQHFKNAKTLEGKLDALESDWELKSIRPVLDVVWSYFKSVSNGENKQDLKRSVLAECKKLDAGLEPISTNISRMNRYERECFFSKDKQSLRLVNLNRFCKLLAKSDY